LNLFLDARIDARAEIYITSWMLPQVGCWGHYHLGRWHLSCPFWEPSVLGWGIWLGGFWNLRCRSHRYGPTTEAVAWVRWRGVDRRLGV